MKEILENLQTIKTLATRVLEMEDKAYVGFFNIRNTSQEKGAFITNGTYHEDILLDKTQEQKFIRFDKKVTGEISLEIFVDTDMKVVLSFRTIEELEEKWDKIFKMMDMEYHWNAVLEDIGDREIFESTIHYQAYKDEEPGGFKREEVYIIEEDYTKE